MNRGGGVRQGSEKNGFALPVLLVVLAASAWAIYGLSERQVAYAGVKESQRVVEDLLVARNALLHYASGYAESYLPTGAGVGHLPCPDTSPINDGIDTNDGPDPPCRHRWLGHMPRHTFADDGHSNKLIEFFPPREYLDQAMWYAVSPTHVNNPASSPLDDTVRGQLQVDGIDDIVAVIIAPGRALGSFHQSRPSDDPEDYLESYQGQGGAEFVASFQTRQGNDRLVYITRSELMQAVTARVGAYLARLAERYLAEICATDSIACDDAADWLPCPEATAPRQTAQRAVEHRCWLETMLARSYPGKQGVASGRTLASWLRRHWLLRNRWPDRYDWRIAGKCREHSPCQVHVQAVRPDEKGRLQLLVRFAEEQGRQP